jgi:hypothetical protein
VAEITREEFQKIYDEKFVPVLEQLDQERLVHLKKCQKWYIFVGLPLFIVLFVVILLCFLKSDAVLVDGFAATFALMVGVIFNASLFSLLLTWVALCIVDSVINVEKFNRKLKKELMSKVLSVYGNLYFSQNKDVISLKEIKSFGLFPNSTRQYIDDVIIGSDNGRNFVIIETILDNYNESSVADFKGLIVKVQMNKSFTGETVVGEKGKVVKKKGFENVELESIDFMQSRKVYSTDQIEARYILTTDFIERLESLAVAFKHEYQGIMAKIQKIFNKNVTIYNGIVSAIFTKGFAYLFIPTNVNFFEVSIYKSLLNFEQYYKIYNELEAILSVFDYLNLDSKTGL